MPIYEYICDDCGEHYVMNGNTKITCPKCASAKNTIQLSVFAAHGNGTKASGGSSPASGSGGGCCGGACGCH